MVTMASFMLAAQPAVLVAQSQGGLYGWAQSFAGAAIGIIGFFAIVVGVAQIAGQLSKMDTTGMVKNIGITIVGVAFILGSMVIFSKDGLSGMVSNLLQNPEQEQVGQ